MAHILVQFRVIVGIYEQVILKSGGVHFEYGDNLIKTKARAGIETD